jgi:hypothetical protein
LPGYTFPWRGGPIASPFSRPHRAQRIRAAHRPLKGST